MTTPSEVHTPLPNAGFEMLITQLESLRRRRKISIPEGQTITQTINYMRGQQHASAFYDTAVNERPDLLARIKRLEEIAKMVDAWGNGLRHPTEHEAKMVKAARAALTE